MKKMNLESIKNLTEIIKNNWEEIITQYNKHIEEKFEDFFLMTYYEYFKGSKTQEITKIISPVFNSILSNVLKPSGFNRCETDGVDYNFEGVAIEGKITLSTSNSWTGNGYKKTNWHLLVKLNLNEDSLRRNGQTHTTRYDLGLDNMLFDYGLILQDNYVVDSKCAYRIAPYAEGGRIQWFYHVLGSPTLHPISKNVENVSLPYVSEIKLPANKEGVRLTPILTSSTNSMTTGLAPVVNLMMPINYGENPQLAADPDNPINKKCLAAVAEGKFESYFKNRIVGAFANNPESGFLQKSSKEGKVLLVGNGRWIANKYDSMPTGRGDYQYRPQQQYNDLQFDGDMIRMRMQHFFGNQEFFQNMTDYMMGDNSVLDIRSRQIDMHPMDKEKVTQDATYYKIMNLLLPIGLILLLGFGMNFIRKRRYA
jgi:gliding-associated putative ABC transporter substrate-binding component GldG